MRPNVRAALLMIAASFFMAAVTLLAKGLAGRFDIAGAQDLHPLQVTAGRFIFGCCVWVSFALITRLRLQQVHWRLHVVRTFFGWTTVTAVFWAGSLMALADATAISFLTPVVTLVLALAFLGERVGWAKGLAVAIMLIGALVLLRPGTSAFQPAALIALTAAVTSAIEAIFIKRLSMIEDRFQILLVNNLIGLPLAVGAAAFVWVWPVPIQWLTLVLVGLGMAGAQFFFLGSMRQADASLVVPFMYSVLIFATVLDFVVFGDAPDWIGGVGAMIIVGGAILLALRDGRASQSKA